jgi:cytochrome c-type biogenesis protein CcmH
MIYGFAAAMAALLAASLVLLFWPLFRSSKAATVSRDALNAAVYRDQLTELARDRAAGTLSESAYQQSTQELRRRALLDTAVPDAPATAQGSKPLLIGIAVLMPLIAIPLYLWLGNPQALTEPPNSRNITPAQIEEMVSNLAARLEKNPNDPAGWAMLARSYKALGRLELAAQAYSRVGPALNDDPDMLSDYAEVLARGADNNFEGRPRELITRALQIDPENMQALGLAGIAAFRRQSYAEAADYLQKLLPKLPPDSEDAKTVAFTIDKARSLAGGDKKTGKPSAKDAKALAASSVSGRVSLAPALAAKVKPDDTLFVFARVAQGPRVPLAVLRARAGALPMNFTLDDSLAMAPQFRLSVLPAGTPLQIEARISKSGEALPKAGDITSETVSAKPGAKGLTIVLDRVVP